MTRPRPEPTREAMSSGITTTKPDTPVSIDIVAQPKAAMRVSLTRS